jgi:Predicted membrane protein (DUF2231)
MAHAAQIGISLGLLLAAPTAITGLLDWLDISRGTPARTAATIHLVVMATTTVLFVLTWLAQRPGYNDDEVRTLALVLGIAAEALLAVGGNIGGANVFVYGIRVLGRPDTPWRKRLTRSARRGRTRRGRRGRLPRRACNEPPERLPEAGVSIWLDTLSREPLEDPVPGRERFYRRDLDPRRWLRVVVDFNESPAFVVTAFVQDHPPEDQA